MKLLSKLFCIFLLVGNEMTAQSDTASSLIVSSIIDHSNIQKYIESHRMIIMRKPFMEGFRIQIYNGNNREDANKVKSEFYSRFPGMRCYVTYQQPYYKVRIGDYEDQTEAKPDLKRMAQYYPSSFLVPDQIRHTTAKENSEKN